MDHGAHAGHGAHEHDAQHEMNHGEHGNLGSAAMAAVSSTVASVLGGLQDHMAAGDHAGHMGYPGDVHSHHAQQAMDHSGHGAMDMGTGHDTGHGDHGGHDMGSMSHMKMWFHTGYTETVLFESWKFSTVGGLIGSMVGIFFMAALYEGLKYYREHLFWRSYNALQYRSVTIPAEKGVVSEDNQIVHMVGEVIHKQPPTMFSWMHCFQTLLHILQMVLSYFLMLIFMTYNVWLCVAVVLGAAVGYFLFGWKKSVIVDVTEHCH